jgi:hypothetical protein
MQRKLPGMASFENPEPRLVCNVRTLLPVVQDSYLTTDGMAAPPPKPRRRSGPRPKNSCTHRPVSTSPIKTCAWPACAGRLKKKRAPGNCPRTFPSPPSPNSHPHWEAPDQVRPSVVCHTSQPLQSTESTDADNILVVTVEPPLVPGLATPSLRNRISAGRCCRRRKSRFAMSRRRTRVQGRGVAWALWCAPVQAREAARILVDLTNPSVSVRALLCSEVFWRSPLVRRLGLGQRRAGRCHDEFPRTVSASACRCLTTFRGVHTGSPRRLKK